MLIARARVLALGRNPSSPVAERARASTWLALLAAGGCKFEVMWEETPEVADDGAIDTSVDTSVDGTPAIDAPAADAFAGAIARIDIEGAAYTGVDYPGAWSADLGVCPGATKLAVGVPINATADDVLFQTAATASSLHCAIAGLPSGTYEVTLLFAEIDRSAMCAPGSRVFAIDIEDTIVAMGFDLAMEGAGCALAGDPGVPVAKTYTAPVTDGVLDVRLTAATPQPALLAAVQAVQIAPSP